MKFIQLIAMAVLTAGLAACGGGGGSPGSTTGATGNGTNNNGTSTTATGDTQATSAGTMTIEVLSGAGQPSTSISAVEIAQAKVTLKDSSGKAVKGAVVTFSESGVNLLSIAPASKTALTDDAGQASVEIRAASTAAVGATVVGASASVAGQAVSAQKAIAVTSAPSNGGGTVIPPQDLANAINFLDVNPSDKSIVLAGAGGNGRSESATLRFRVVDKNNTPVKGVAVTFAVVPAGDVTLNISTAVSDAEGVVLTTVSSKNVATAVVVKATVDGKSISSQSDQLLVTTGVVTQAGFDLSATKYNLNYGITGDSSDITVRIVDINGNPVADGVPVVFTTNFGAVGTSSRGGCATTNGSCVVTYSVQDPRPLDGTRARVTASTQTGNGGAVSGSLDLTISNLAVVNLYSAATGGVVVNSFSAAPTNACKFTRSVFLGTTLGFPAPAGTTVAIKGITSDFAATVKTGSPVLDLETQRTPLSLEFDASSASLAPPCVSGGANTATAQVEIRLTAGSRVTILPLVNISYPTN
jgi:hypothetical protein